MAAISVTPEELKQQAQVYIQSKEQIEQAIRAYLEQYTNFTKTFKNFKYFLKVLINNSTNTQIP